ncbi:NAD(P)-dependent oxidoreductase [Uniformispora flossi]|uniref:NAD(P)-dependent oxidoreductase n=1 Tax=Uniformispora flossi TaxID=3390723 RepID=UPI003C2B49AA
MKIIVLGATGMIGSRIAVEALARGHQVTALSRRGGGPAGPGSAAVAADVSDTERMAELVAGHDAVASALVPPRDGSDPVAPYVALNEALIAGVRESGVRRLVVTSGAGSLRDPASGEELVDQPGFPAAYRPEALAHRAVLALYRTVDDLDWTLVSPAPEIAPGERTGKYRIGGDDLLPGVGHHTRISAEDFAVAVLDELEGDGHPRRRISVADPVD